MDVREKASNEKRLIDASAMRDDWLENGENEYVYDTNAVLDSIDSQPTVDAVEVVRCRYCIHYFSGACLKIFTDGDASRDAWQERYDDDFCSYGERKEGADNEP